MIAFSSDVSKSCGLILISILKHLVDCSGEKQSTQNIILLKAALFPLHSLQSSGG